MTFLKKTALVYCEKQFGLIDGKTANGLVRYSEKYTIVGIIDSSLAGRDAGEEIGIERNKIPIFINLADALSKLPKIPDCYIYGKAPIKTTISNIEKALIIEAMEKGMDIINGLQQFFSEDKELISIAIQNDVKIKDIRKPRKITNLHVYNGQISKVNIPIIAVLGTDCACGKRTTAVELNNTLKSIGINSVLIATGQSGLMQGLIYGISMDAMISQFVIGEIENEVVKAFKNENPDIIIVEGQSSVSHPAFMSSLGILKGCMPDGVILQHPPARKSRCDFPWLKMPLVESEIKLIETISQTKVMAITLSHEGLSNEEMICLITEYQAQFKLPTTDVLNHGCQKLVQTLGHHFPKVIKSQDTEYSDYQGKNYHTEVNYYNFLENSKTVISSTSPLSR